MSVLDENPVSATAGPVTELRPSATPGSPDAAVACVRGRRRIAADAAVIAGHGAGTAVAVADGIGDSAAAARAARIAADAAVRSAPGAGTRAAILAARDALDADRGADRGADREAGNAVLAVAAGLPGGGWTVSWVGDCRALLWDGAVLEPLTRDHTMAEELRALGVAAGGAWENVVTTTVAAADPATLGHVWGPPGPGTLVLLSDGVHRTLPAARIAGLLAAGTRPGETARALVAAALEAGSRDNATAAVLRLPRSWAAGQATVRIPAPRSA